MACQADGKPLVEELLSFAISGSLASFADLTGYRLVVFEFARHAFGASCIADQAIWTSLGNAHPQDVEKADQRGRIFSSGLAQKASDSEWPVADSGRESLSLSQSGRLWFAFGRYGPIAKTSKPRARPGQDQPVQARVPVCVDPGGRLYTGSAVGIAVVWVERGLFSTSNAQDSCLKGGRQVQRATRKGDRGALLG